MRHANLAMSEDARSRDRSRDTLASLREEACSTGRLTTTIYILERSLKSEDGAKDAKLECVP